MALPAFDVNYIAVIVAAVVSFLFGFLWYGPMFGKQWMKMMGFTDKSMKSMKTSMGKSMAFGFVGLLITSFVLSLFVDFLQATTIMDALVVGFLIWLGFFVTTMAGSVLWEGKSWKLYGFNITYHLINLSIITIILTLWA
ncbi:MAG TPA: DUF1761 domain-containing protein [Candidatus Nanoarchaeia archaeon]|nr:DUF1761 domain-containing protein [Candidatus Nanoarchaeia archaeon]